VTMIVFGAGPAAFSGIVAVWLSGTLIVEFETDELFDWWEGASLISDETVRSARTSAGSLLLLVVVSFLARTFRGDKTPEALLKSCGVLLGLERSAAAIGRGGTPALRALTLDEALTAVEVPGGALVGETSPEARVDALADTVVRTEVTELDRLDVGLGTVTGTLIAAPVRAVALVVRRRSGLEGNVRFAGVRLDFLVVGEIGMVSPVEFDFWLMLVRRERWAPMVVVDASDRIDTVEGIFRTAGGFWFATVLRRPIDVTDGVVERLEATEPDVTVLALGGLLVLASGGFLGSVGLRGLGAFEPVRSLVPLERLEVALGAGLGGREVRVRRGATDE